MADKAKTFDFTALPKNVLEKILKKLFYDDLVNLRYMNKWFNDTCKKILNHKFKSLEAAIDEALYLNKDKIDKMSLEVSSLRMHQKILQILKSELKILMAVCGKYVHYSCYCFSGGKILDCFDKILYSDYGLNENIKNPLQSSCAMKLFLYNDEFMDYFEEKIEPEILDCFPTPVFGSKMFDILDSCVHKNYNIIVSHEDNNLLQISAQYELLKPDLINPPPKFESPFDETQLENLLSLSRYVRNQVRWYNFFLFVDSNESLFECKKRNKRYSKLCLNPTDDNSEHKEELSDENSENGQKYNKVFSRRIGNPSSNANISYSLELVCNKHLAPSRFDYLNPEQEFNSDSLKEISEDSLNNYEFSMNLKIILSSTDNTTAMENSIDMIHNKEGYLIKEKENEIPI